MGVGRAGMEKIMEVPEGTKSGSRLWFSSPTPRHRSTHSISEQDRCPVWAHLSVPARQGVGRGMGLWLESVQALGLPEASQTESGDVFSPQPFHHSKLPTSVLVPFSLHRTGTRLVLHCCLSLSASVGTGLPPAGFSGSKAHV